MDARKKISLVAPFYNEESNVRPFLQQVHAALAPVLGTYDIEIICVNDGSRDGTLEALRQARQHHPQVKIIDFSRNFGKEAAITAGLDFATGDAVIPIDSDLQHPPELILEMLAHWESGFEVVLARRTSRETDQALQRLTARAFYEVSRYISHIEIPADVGDYRLMDRKVVDALKALQEKCRFMKGLFAWVGFRTTVVNYQVVPRVHGKSSFNTWKLGNFALEGITSFSTLPLRVWTYLGGVVSLGAFIYAAYLIIKTLVFGVEVPGYASLMIVILLASGVQLIGIGILGEYLGRVFTEVKNRPIYIVREVIGP
mgnify:FL=1